MQKILQQFIQNLKDGDFSQAHIVMEQQWKIYKKEDHPLTKLLKGYINGATAFELVNRGKISGAKQLWATYEKYLPLLERGIDGYELFVEADSILQELSRERLSA